MDRIAEVLGVLGDADIFCNLDGRLVVDVEKSRTKSGKSKSATMLRMKMISLQVAAAAAYSASAVDVATTLRRLAMKLIGPPNMKIV